jgi:hypothetical protein
MYQAYVRREEGDSAGALEAVDSAWAAATNEGGRRAVDSVRVADFGLESLLDVDPSAGEADHAPREESVAPPDDVNR